MCGTVSSSTRIPTGSQYFVSLAGPKICEPGGGGLPFAADVNNTPDAAADDAADDAGADDAAGAAAGGGL